MHFNSAFSSYFGSLFGKKGVLLAPMSTETNHQPFQIKNIRITRVSQSYGLGAAVKGMRSTDLEVRLIFSGGMDMWWKGFE